MRTLVADDEPPRRPGPHGLAAVTATSGGAGSFSLTVSTPPPPAGPVVMAGVAVEDIRPGDVAELVVEHGRAIIRRRRRG